MKKSFIALATAATVGAATLTPVAQAAELSSSAIANVTATNTMSANNLQCTIVYPKDGQTVTEVITPAEAKQRENLLDGTLAGNIADSDLAFLSSAKPAVVEAYAYHKVLDACDDRRNYNIQEENIIKPLEAIKTAGVVAGVVAAIGAILAALPMLKNILPPQIKNLLP